jgi:hypothetical protein
MTHRQVVAAAANKIIHTQCSCVLHHVTYWLLCVNMVLYTVEQHVDPHLTFLYKAWFHL